LKSNSSNSIIKFRNASLWLIVSGEEGRGAIGHRGYLLRLLLLLLLFLKTKRIEEKILK